MNKQVKVGFVLSLCAILIGFSSCLEDSCAETRSFVEFEALFAHPDDFRIDPSFVSERKLEIPGKIYFYNDMIMINERYEGIHIYDNSDPSSPQSIGFLAIPGNLDVSIRNDIMYADSYVDLLTIDVANLQHPRLLCREELVFNNYNWIEDDARGYYVGTKETNRTVEIDCGNPNFGSGFFWGNESVFVDADFANTNGGFIGTTENNRGSTPTSTANAITGVGGSFARFSVLDDYLYVLNLTELISYNLGDPLKPTKTETTTVGWQIETLFPYEDHLFIGGNNGMFIYDRIDPAAPQFVSAFRHANACDPVFVKDDIAYVTLRNGTACQNFINQLDVLDVSNIRSPQLIESFDMDHPHGLAVRANNLYICEGSHGLKVFENDDLNKIDDNRVAHIKDIDAYDVISLAQDHLLVIGADGLYQYDSSDPSDLELLSFLPSTP